MHFVETIIAYLQHASDGGVATPGWQHLRRYQPGANHNRVPPARCSLCSPPSLPLGIPSARCHRSPPPLPLAATASPRHRSARCHRFHSPGTAILDFGGDFGIILGIFGGNFGFRWQFWEVSAIFRWQFWEVLGNFRWQFWENCLFLQCNNERQSLRGDNKAKGYHCAKIIM